MPQKSNHHRVTSTSRSGLRKRPSGATSPTGVSSSGKSKSTGLVYDDRMLQHRHEWFCNEQESPIRIQRAYERCHEEGLISRCMLVPAKHISEDSLALIHDRNYIELVRCSRTFTRQELYDVSSRFDGVFFNEFTWNCASLAAGSLKSLTHLVAQGRLLNGLALIRPPGHHAMHAEACGYCIFNNVAVAAASLLSSAPNGISSCSANSDISLGLGRKSHKSTTISSPGDSDMNALPLQTTTANSVDIRLSRQDPNSSLSPTVVLERILILDWDVHHGQGTQYAFYEDSRVLYISIHRYEKANFWPNLREANYDFVGHGSGRGFNVNIPLEQMDMTDADYLAVFHQLVMPIALEYNPQLVIVSCGFDAAIGCPEGRMWLTPALFGHFVNHLKILAGGKIVVALEGGYYVDSLAESVVHVLKSLLGDPITPIRLARVPCKSIRKTIELCTTALRPYWKSLWIQDVSRIVDRPNLSHLPMITWPLVKRVVWPETNPLLPEHLARRVHELMNHGIAMCLPEPEDQPYLLLVPIRQSTYLNESKTKIDCRGNLTRKPKLVCPWSKKLLVKQSNCVHIHFYRESDSTNQMSTNNKKPCNSSSSSLTANLDEVSIRPTKRRRLTHDHDLDESDHQIQLPHSRNLTSTVCGCSLSTGRGVNKWISTDISSSVPVLSIALEKAITDLFLRRFIRVVLVGHELTPFELVDGIGQIPDQLLFTYQGRLLHSRMGHPLASPVVFPLHNAIHSRHNGDMTSRAIESVVEGDSRTLELESPTQSRIGLNPSDSHSTGSVGIPDLYKTTESNQTCRILVLDLTGCKDPGKDDNQPRNLDPEGHIRSDLLWCSLYTDSMADHLASSPSLLRVNQLFHSHEHSARGRPIHSAHWLRIPVITTNQLKPHGCGAKSVPGKDVLCANLCAVLLHFILPIAYEYGPELVFLRLSPEWAQSDQDCVDLAVSHLIHLIGGLGCAMLVSLTSAQPPSSWMLNNLFNPTPDSVQLGQPDRMVPTAKMQTAIRHMLRENSFRWNSLRFADSLPKWR